MTEDEPIAMYRETRLEGKRVFELFPDRIRVRGEIQLRSEFDMSFPLVRLDPNPMRIRVRHKSFWAGLWILLAAVVLDSVLISGFHFPPETFCVGLIGCMGMSGFVLMLATLRKVEYVMFANLGGVHVLGIARSGPDAGELDSLVQLTRTAIGNATGDVHD